MIITYESPLGLLYLEAQNEKLTHVFFEETLPTAQRPVLAVGTPCPSPVLNEAIHWLNLYFSGNAPSSLPALMPLGTSFQLRVWQALLQIPYAKTITYSDLAHTLYDPLPKMAIRAVAQAISKNPLPIFIPCHRVVAKHHLGGYTPDIRYKEQLLQIEHKTRNLYRKNKLC